MFNLFKNTLTPTPELIAGNVIKNVTKFNEDEKNKIFNQMTKLIPATIDPNKRDNLAVMNIQNILIALYENFRQLADDENKLSRYFVFAVNQTHSEILNAVAKHNALRCSPSFFAEMLKQQAMILDALNTVKSDYLAQQNKILKNTSIQQLNEVIRELRSQANDYKYTEENAMSNIVIGTSTISKECGRGADTRYEYECDACKDGRCHGRGYIVTYNNYAPDEKAREIAKQSRLAIEKQIEEKAAVLNRVTNSIEEQKKGIKNKIENIEKITRILAFTEKSFTFENFDYDKFSETTYSLEKLCENDTALRSINLQLSSLADVSTRITTELEESISKVTQNAQGHTIVTIKNTLENINKELADYRLQDNHFDSKPELKDKYSQLIQAMGNIREGIKNIETLALKKGASKDEIESALVILTEKAEDFYKTELQVFRKAYHSQTKLQKEVKPAEKATNAYGTFNTNSEKATTTGNSNSSAFFQLPNKVSALANNLRQLTFK